MNELSQVSVVPGSTSGKETVPEKDMRVFLNILSSGEESENWITMGGQSPKRSSPTKQAEVFQTVVSPNGFQLLQDIPEEEEEGEIIEAKDRIDDSGDNCLATVDEPAGSQGTKRSGVTSGQRGKGKHRPVIANTRGLVQAVSSGQTKKSSSRRK